MEKSVKTLAVETLLSSNSIDVARLAELIVSRASYDKDALTTALYLLGKYNPVFAKSAIVQKGEKEVLYTFVKYIPLHGAAEVKYDSTETVFVKTTEDAEKFQQGKWVSSKDAQDETYSVEVTRTSTCCRELPVEEYLKGTPVD